MVDYQQYINALRKCAKEHDNDRTPTGHMRVSDLCRDTADMLEELEQEPKTGHWEQYGNSWEDKFKCSECGKEQPKILCGERIIGHWSDYCPNCGAKMKGDTE